MKKSLDRPSKEQLLWLPWPLAAMSPQALAVVVGGRIGGAMRSLLKRWWIWL
jgi:hypothetical protein